MKYLGAAINGTIGDPLPFSSWYALLPVLAITLFIGPLGEEFGWRGVRAATVTTSIRASLGLPDPWSHLGVCGICQHLFWAALRRAYRRPFGPYVVGVLALSVIVTPMFNATRGSILIPILFHYQMNLPIWPEAQPGRTTCLQALP